MKDHLQGRLKGAFQLGPEHILLGVLFIGSVGLVGWTFTERLFLITEAHAKVYSSIHLEREISTLKTLWSGERQREIQKQLALGRKSLLGGLEQMSEWLNEVDSRASHLGFQLRVKIKKIEPHPKISGVNVVPIRFELTNQNSSRAFSSSVMFIQELTSHPIRVDLEKMVLSGNGNGAKDLVLDVQAWMQAEE